MSRTVITHPDGSVTTVQSRSGCAAGCAWVFWLLLVVFVVAFPAESFPLWGAICAYIVEGVIALAGVAAWVQRRQVGPPGVK
jgi:Na+/melibiose symporter-like transporter